MAKLLNWVIFSNQLSKSQIFTPLDVRRVFGISNKTAALAVHRYHKRGLVERLRRGLYTFPDKPLTDPYLANSLYSPSYVSLEFALSFHGVIPDAVYSITSVTPKATRTFRARGKVFTYHRIKASAFTGYKIERQQGVSFYMADPEKAFVDLMYLRMRSGSKPLTRFNKNKLNPLKTFRYATLFMNEKLTSIIEKLLR